MHFLQKPFTQNISSSGLQFLTASSNDLRLLDEVALSFLLDIPSRKRITKRAITRHVQGITVGGEFTIAVDQDRKIVLYPV